VLKYTTLNVECGTRNADAETLKDSTFDVLHSTFRLRFSAACWTPPPGGPAGQGEVAVEVVDVVVVVRAGP
jgi:hypothetical protein